MAFNGHVRYHKEGLCSESSPPIWYGAKAANVNAFIGNLEGILEMIWMVSEENRWRFLDTYRHRGFLK